MAGVKKELWTGEILRRFKADDSFLKEVPDKSSYVTNDVIHLNEVDVSPKVLLNNTTYPIPVVDYTDKDIALSLGKLETENTRIRTDQLQAVTYSPILETVKGHSDSLKDFAAQYALHSFCPRVDTVKTPVMRTTGETDPDTGRKKLTRKDIIDFRKRLDNINIPRKGRILVLSPEHEADLIENDNTLDLKLHDVSSGDLKTMYYSFKIYTYTDVMPLFDSGNMEKIAFGGAVSQGNTALITSVFFHKKRVIKALGSTEMYYSQKNKNPEQRASLIGFEQRFLALPKKLEGLGALVSPPAP